MPAITPVIMSGGSGTRLWPLSRSADPKQYRPLVTDRSMLEETVARVARSDDSVRRPVVVCAADHCERVTRLVDPETVITEPMGRNTAPVAIIASLHVAADDPDGLVLLMPADHHVRDPDAFWEAVARGQRAAEQGYLVTLGITPTGPETGFGYIRRGEALTDGVFRVDAFVEKPDEATARGYLEEGGYAWNAGIFLFRAKDLLEEARAHVPEMLDRARAAFEGARREGAALHLGEALFAAVPADSIDYAIMERTDRAAVVSPVEIGWDDIGSWSAVADHAGASAGEASKGDVIMLDCEGSYVRSEGPMVAAVGVKDVVIVAMKDTVLVIDKNRAQDVKTIIERLKTEGRSALL